MAGNSDGVVVTEAMLTEAALAGDLDVLRVWARQSVCVATAEPLYIATRGGRLEVLHCLVRELGADVNQKRRHGVTVLHVAASSGHLAVVRCLIELGAEVGAVDNDGDPPLLVSALNGQFETMWYLLEEAGADMGDVNNGKVTVWDLLIAHLEDDNDMNANENFDSAALTSLLRVMVLRSNPPPALVALPLPEPARVVQEGARLRARLPAYLAHRRAYLDLRCPRISLLPGVLRALIYTFEGPFTTEELWATGLGQPN
jgi:hypothetical protein